MPTPGDGEVCYVRAGGRGHRGIRCLGAQVTMHHHVVALGTAHTIDDASSPGMPWGCPRRRCPTTVQPMKASCTMSSARDWSAAASWRGRTINPLRGIQATHGLVGCALGISFPMTLETRGCAGRLTPRGRNERLPLLQVRGAEIVADNVVAERAQPGLPATSTRRPRPMCSSCRSDMSRTWQALAKTSAEVGRPGAAGPGSGASGRTRRRLPTRLQHGRAGRPDGLPRALHVMAAGQWVAAGLTPPP